MKNQEVVYTILNRASQAELRRWNYDFNVGPELETEHLPDATPAVARRESHEVMADNCPVSLAVGRNVLRLTNQAENS